MMLAAKNNNNNARAKKVAGAWIGVVSGVTGAAGLALMVKGIVDYYHDKNDIPPSPPGPPGPPGPPTPGGFGSPCKPGDTSSKGCEQWQKNVKSAYYTCQKNARGQWTLAGVDGTDQCVVQCADDSAMAPDAGSHSCVVAPVSCDAKNTRPDAPATTRYKCTCLATNPDLQCSKWKAAYVDVNGTQVDVPDNAADGVCKYVNRKGSPLAPMAFPSGWEFNSADGGNWLERTCGPSGHWDQPLSNQFTDFECQPGYNSTAASAYACVPSSSPGTSCDSSQPACPVVPGHSTPSPVHACSNVDPGTQWCVDGSPNETCVAMDSQQNIVGHYDCTDNVLGATCRPCCLSGAWQVGKKCFACPMGFGLSKDADGSLSCYRMPPNQWDNWANMKSFVDSRGNFSRHACNQNGQYGSPNAGWVGWNARVQNYTATSCTDNLVAPLGSWYCSKDSGAYRWTKCLDPSGCNHASDAANRSIFSTWPSAACTTSHQAPTLGDPTSCGAGVDPKDCAPFQVVNPPGASTMGDSSSCALYSAANGCPPHCQVSKTDSSKCVPTSSSQILSKAMCGSIAVVPNGTVDPQWGNVEPNSATDVLGCGFDPSNPNTAVWCRGFTSAESCPVGCTWNADSDVCTACNEYSSTSCPVGCSANSNDWTCS